MTKQTTDLTQILTIKTINMNSHIIPSQTIAKLKRLNAKISGLRQLKSMGVLTPKLALKLELKENKLTKIISSL